MFSRVSVPGGCAAESTRFLAAADAVSVTQPRDAARSHDTAPSPLRAAPEGGVRYRQTEGRDRSVIVKRFVKFTFTE